MNMATARVFRSGNSQAVRLPKEFRSKSRDVEIFRRGDEIVLREKGKGVWREHSRFWRICRMTSCPKAELIVRLRSVKAFDGRISGSQKK
jgi:hypothetical protein